MKKPQPISESHRDLTQAGEIERLRGALQEIVDHFDKPCKHESLTWCLFHIKKTALMALRSVAVPSQDR